MGWLIPYVEPSYKLTIKDDDYPYKTGNYYVIATEVEFGSKGGSRKVTIGRRIQYGSVSKPYTFSGSP